MNDYDEIYEEQPVEETVAQQHRSNNYGNQRTNRNQQPRNNNYHRRNKLDEPNKNNLHKKHHHNKPTQMGKRDLQNEIQNSSQKNDAKKNNDNKSNAVKTYGKKTPLSGDEKAKITIKIPLKIKIVLYGFIILIPLFALLMFVVLFSDENQSLGGGAGGFAYGQTCNKVTVINTDCDASNQNCTNKYNGEVETENYIAGVVAAESKGNTNTEYLKLLSVVARTNFVENIGSSCTVEGNSNFQTYMDINDSSNSSQVKQAVADTKNFITISNDNVVEIEYGYGNIVSEDSGNYYVSYGKNTLGTEKLQAIPKSWANSQSIFKNYLDNWESSPETSTELSLIGALYLITNESYTYQNVVEYYYGSDVEVTENTMILSGINGYMNPTSNIVCTSPYGYRTHPVTGQKDSFHGGLDIGVSGPIYAAKDGVVSRVVDYVTIINATKSNYESGYAYGNNIIIDHGDGTSTLYAHIKYGTIPDYVYEGATIKQGQQIGYTGSTGRSTGVHLHYEVRLNGERIDPADYLDLTNATGTCRK